MQYLKEDRDNLEKFLGILPTSSSPGEWKFSKETNGVKKYTVEHSFDKHMSELAHFDRTRGQVFHEEAFDLDQIKKQEHDAQKQQKTSTSQATTTTQTEEQEAKVEDQQPKATEQEKKDMKTVQGFCLQSTIKAPIEYVVDHFLNPEFNISYDPRIKFMHRISHDNTPYSNLVYINWEKPSVFPPSSERHSMIRTALYHHLQAQNITNYKKLGKFITDRCEDKELRKQMDRDFDMIDQDHSYPDVKGQELFNKSLRGSTAMLWQSVAPEFGQTLLRQLEESHVDIQKGDTVEATVFPMSGLYFREVNREDVGQPTPPGEGSTSKEREDFENSIPKYHTEVYMVLFVSKHWSHIWGDGPFASSKPLAMMRDRLEYLWGEHQSQETHVPIAHRNIDAFLSSPPRGRREITPVPTRDTLKGYRDPTYVYVPPKKNDGIDRMIKEQA